MRWTRVIVHADMDAFYAQIEQLDDPTLRGKPILVGPKSRRGVVLTASYEARPFGVGSAMPMARAVQRCPKAIIVPPRFERYTEVSQIIMKTFGDFSADVEALSLDEAFMDMTGAEGIFGPPEEMGRRLKKAVRDATGGLTVSVGIAESKYVAKVASDYDKPDGLTLVPPGSVERFLWPLPVRKLWGAGPKTTARLESFGFFTIGDIAQAEPAELERKLGRMGLHFYQLSRGIDPRRVDGKRSMRSIGSERTLEKDVRTKAEIDPYVRRSADEIGRRLRKKKARAHGVRLKLKTTDFQLVSRQRKLDEPTDVAQTLHQVALELLDDLLLERGSWCAYRLVGLAAYDLVGADDGAQLPLFDQQKRRKIESTIDMVNQKFGLGKVMRAEDLEKKGILRTGPNLDFMDDPE